MIGDAYELHIPGKLYVIYRPLALLNLCENYLVLGNDHLEKDSVVFCLKSNLKGPGTNFQSVINHFLFGTKTLIFDFPFTINPNIIDLYK